MNCNMALDFFGDLVNEPTALLLLIRLTLLIDRDYETATLPPAIMLIHCYPVDSSKGNGINSRIGKVK